MCRGHAVLIESERLYDDINVEDGPLKHRHRKALAAIRSEGAQAKSGWRWPGSLAAKANGTAIQTPDPTFSKATRGSTGQPVGCGNPDLAAELPVRSIVAQ